MIRLLFAAILLSGCCTHSVPPARPSNVPPSAFWIGGVDGGAWVDVRNVKSKDKAELVIYNDRVMEWSRGSFVVSGGEISKNEIRKQAQHFDGDKLIFSDGRVMQKAK